MSDREGRATCFLAARSNKTISPLERTPVFFMVANSLNFLQASMQVYEGPFPSVWPSVRPASGLCVGLFVPTHGHVTEWKHSPEWWATRNTSRPCWAGIQSCKTCRITVGRRRTGTWRWNIRKCKLWWWTKTPRNCPTTARWTCRLQNTMVDLIERNHEVRKKSIQSNHED